MRRQGVKRRDFLKMAAAHDLLRGALARHKDARRRT